VKIAEEELGSCYVTDNSIRFLAQEKRSSSEGAAASPNTLTGNSILIPQERGSILSTIE